jgi:O-methyltransferase
MLEHRRLEIVRRIEFDATARADGRDWPIEAETMIGLKRLLNLQQCIVDVIRNDVPGDLIETGVWRGGATIFMRAVLKAYGDTERTVWVADSFEGLPPPNPERYPADRGDTFHTANNVLGVSLEEVKSNFARYGLLDDQVRFLKGWFRDTLPTAPIERLAVLRLDGDMYESTIGALRALYPKLSVGGYLIVDDFEPGTPGCIRAVQDYRAENGMIEPMRRIDHSGIFWQRER